MMVMNEEKANKNLDDLQQILGYRFKQPFLCRIALRLLPECEHDFQRLEFLGDTVLGMVVADCLYRLFPDDNEGQLSRRHRSLVCGDTLRMVAKSWHLARLSPMLSRASSDTGPPVIRAFADTVEALLGAIYCDGGLNAVRKLIEAHWQEWIRVQLTGPPPLDAKSALQEWCLKRALGLPVYHLDEKRGPDHRPSFTVSVKVKGQQGARANAASKNQAEQKAAAQLLDRIYVDND